MIVLGIILLLTFIELVSGNPFMATTVGTVYAKILRGKRVPDLTKVQNVNGRVLEMVPTEDMILYVTDRDFKGVNFDPSAIAIGKVVIMERSAVGLYSLYHEEGHVRQYRRFTSLGFLIAYTFLWAVKALQYKRGWWDEHPLEQDADRWADRNYLP